MTHNNFPKYLSDMVLRITPEFCRIVADSTPIPFFGNLGESQIATIGINPSLNEFKPPRVATLESLGAESTHRMTDEQAEQLLVECRDYFMDNGKKPFVKWFGPLDDIISRGLQSSYEDGQACHLDISQWATDPVWNKLGSQIQFMLLEEGVPYLKSILLNEDIRIVVVNGIAVWNHLKLTGLATSEQVGELKIGKQSTRLFEGVGCGAHFLGWSMNIQGNRATNDMKDALADWLAENSGGGSKNPVSETSAGFLSPMQLSSKEELITTLKSWLGNSSEATIGDIQNFGGRGLIKISLPDGRDVTINADTKRAAVEEYIAHAPDNKWLVVSNNRGVFNKVTFRSDKAAVKGWYCYLDVPESGEFSI
jgi:hypothetical protein